MMPPSSPLPPPDPYARLTARKVLVFPLLIVAVLFLLTPDFGDDPRVEALTDLVVEVILFTTAFLWAVVHKVDFRTLIGNPGRLRDHRWPLLTLALIAFSIGALWILFAPLSFAFPAFVEEWVLDSPALYLPGQTVANILWFLGAVVLAPVGEELLFRGFLLRRWTRRYGWPVAAGLSSVIFGLMHTDILGAVVFGVVLCGLARATDGLWAPMAVHALNNLMAFGFSVIWAEYDWPIAANVAEFRAEGWWALPLGLVGLAGVGALRGYWSAPPQPPPLPRY